MKRHPNPSPVAALDSLLAKELEHGNNDPKRVDGDMFPILDTPWPILMKLAISAYPAEECDWSWKRASLPGANPPYRKNYWHPKKVCKASNWFVDSMPRILEDGRMCGGLSYFRAAKQTCAGKPSGQAVMPGHGAGIMFDRLPTGQFKHTIFASIYSNDKYLTYVHSGNEMPTDEVTSIQKALTLTLTLTQPQP